MKLDYDQSKVELCIKNIKVLSADAIEKAKSGHPGMPLGCADLAFILWHYFLRFNPKDPEWIGRDIFILSAGHGSMLLYSLLNMYDYGVSVDDIKQFRQLGSITPGHPEYGITKGVETTTGPLGQGFATGVGFALARKVWSQKYPIFKDTKVYAIVSDGDLMEGISTEAASIAGNLKLDNLIYLYDKNKISIEGSTDITFTENIVDKFEALGWFCLEVDAYDHTQVIGALNTAQKTKNKPTLIVANTIIGKDAKCKENDAASHGAPLGSDELQCLKGNLSWSLAPFEVPQDVYEFASQKIKYMQTEYKKWNAEFIKMLKVTSVKEGVDLLCSKVLSDDLYKELRNLPKNQKEASRKTSGKCIQVIAKYLPHLIGGSADLGPSNNTTINSSTSIASNDFSGRNIHYGVREHAMGSIANGLSLHGGFIPFVGTFLIFSDYMRSSIRLSSLMSKQVIYVFTHDSIYVGEDGPTHQPIEQISSLRLIPRLKVIRPACDYETVEAWIYALRNTDSPTALILSRQDLKSIDGLEPEIILNNFDKGAYVIAKEESEKADYVVVASGSEVVKAVDARKILGLEKNMRIVSVPCLDLFMEQGQEYINEVIPFNAKKISIEAGSTKLWASIVGLDGLSIGVDDFGVSAPAEQAAKKMRIDTDSVVEKIKAFIN